jgi:hypothetical protein
MERYHTREESFYIHEARVINTLPNPLRKLKNTSSEEHKLRRTQAQKNTSSEEHKLRRTQSQTG